MITNNTFLDGPTRRVMREHLLTTFDELYVVDLHGNSVEREVCPDGSPDVNVFDIQQGVAVSLFLKCPEPEDHGLGGLWLWNLQGSRQAKYDWLTGNTSGTTDWQAVPISPPLFLFQETDAELVSEYERFVGYKTSLELPEAELRLIETISALI